MDEKTDNPDPQAVAPTTTAFAPLVADLNAGVFEQQVERALSDVALGVVLNGRQGEVTLKFAFKRIGESNQVSCIHTLSYNKPTLRGKATETYTTETPLHVGRGGKLSLMPDEQTRFQFDDERRERLNG